MHMPGSSIKIKLTWNKVAGLNWVQLNEHACDGKDQQMLPPDTSIWTYHAVVTDVSKPRAVEIRDELEWRWGPPDRSSRHSLWCCTWSGQDERLDVWFRREDHHVEFTLRFC